MRGIFLFLTFVLFVQAAVSAGEPSQVSRTPHSDFEILRPFLTPFETAITLPESARGKSDHGFEMPLHETLVLINESGSSVTVRHRIVKILEESGIKIASGASFEYDNSRDKASLFLARTIRADGSPMELEEKAAFIKKPEEAAADLHSGTETLSLVFPDVKPGAYTESIFIKENWNPVIPGEFTKRMGWGFPFPVRRERFVLIAPKATAQRIRWQALGVPSLKPEQTELESGLVKFEWQTDGITPRPFETNGPSMQQVGPMLRIGTIKSWELIGKWFAQLLEKSSNAGETVQNIAKEWAENATSPREIAVNLYRHVSNDIRYTALEFGEGDYCPRDVETVLATRYGDCKDKANLLRVLLREKHIASKIVLLDTEGMGSIDSTIPSIGCFNHAILRIELEGEDPIYCDPTIAKSSLGTLSRGDIARDVFLVDETGSGSWSRTPSQITNSWKTWLELTLEPGGGFSGWVTVRSDQVSGAAFANTFASLNRERAIKTLQDSILGALRATVIDYQLVHSDNSIFETKAYVIKSGTTTGKPSTSERVAFPMVRLFTPVLGDDATRDTPMRGLISQSEMHGILRFPTDWSVLDLPPPFEASAAGVTLKSNWQIQGKQLLCEAVANTTLLSIPASDYPALWKAVKTWQEWGATPALFKIESLQKNAKSTAKTTLKSAVNFPKMFSAEGQSALIQKRYPFNSNDLLSVDYPSRRAAYAQGKRYFPQNADFEFEADLQFILCDLMEKEGEGVTESARKLIERNKEKLDREKLAAGEIMLIAGLLVQEKQTEAFELARKLVEDSTLSDPIRCAAAYMAMLTLPEEAPPEESIRYSRLALETANAPETNVSECAIVLMFSLPRMPDSRPETLLAEFDQLRSRFQSQAADLGEMISEIPAELLDSGYYEAAKLLSDTLDSVKDSDRFDDDGRETLEEVREELALATEAVPAQLRVREWLKANPITIPAPKEVPLERPTGVGDCTDEFDSNEPGPEAMQFALWRLTEYGPQPNYDIFLEDAVETANSWIASNKGFASGSVSQEQLEKLIDFLVEAYEQMPEANTGTSMKIRGDLTRRREGSEAELNYFLTLSNSSDRSQQDKSSAHNHAANIYLEKHDYSNAITHFEKSLDPPDSGSRENTMVVLTFVCIAAGEHEKAWKIMDKIISEAAESKEVKPLPDNTELLRSIAMDPKRSTIWWRESSKWWEKWENITSKIKVNLVLPAGGSVVHLPNVPEWINETPEDYLQQMQKYVDDDETEISSGMMLNLLNCAHWDYHFAPHAVLVLRKYGSKHFPKETKAMRALAADIESAYKDLMK